MRWPHETLQLPRYRGSLTLIRQGGLYAAAMRIRPLAVDALIAAALTSVALLLGPEAVRQGQNPLDVTAYALVVLVHLPLVLRGRAPVVVCCLVHATWLVYITAGHWAVVCSFGPMLAVYTVASLRAPRVSSPAPR